MSEFEVLTDQQIAEKLGEQYDYIRRKKAIPDKELLEVAGTSSAVLAKLRSGKGTITLQSFIKLIRGIGELRRLEDLFYEPEPFSPTMRVNEPPARIHKIKPEDADFIWGEDQTS